jgi:hypothetical protein
MLPFLMLITTVLLSNTDTIAPNVPAPNVDLKNQTEVQRYEDSVGGKLLYWKCKHRIAVYGHKNGGKEGYTSYYEFADKDKNMVTALIYSMMPAKWLRIATAEYDTASPSYMAYLMDVNTDCKDFKEAEQKNKQIPRYNNVSDILENITALMTWAKAKYPKADMLSGGFSDVNVDFLGLTKSPLNVEVGAAENTTNLDMPDGSYRSNKPWWNVFIIVCKDCSLVANQPRIGGR